MAGNSADPGRSVASKVIAILLAFRDGDQHSITEIARLAGLPLSTAHRLVNELAVWGVLERTSESRFRVGLPIKALGSQTSYSPALLESARRVLEDLATAAGTRARLGILAGQEVAYIEKRCDYNPVTTFEQAARMPAHATALGKALLAFSPPELLDHVLGGGLKRYTANTLTDPGRLRQSLAAIRVARVAVSRWELEPEVCGVAVPVFGLGGRAVAALELSVPNLRADLRMASSALTVAARGLSRELIAGGRAGYLGLVTEQPAHHQAGRKVPA